MIGNIVLVAMQVAGIFGAIKLPPEQKESLHNFLPLICGKYGAGDKAAAVEAGILQFLDCLGELYDTEDIKREMTIAAENGTVHTVIEGYCEKAPQVKKCILEGLERVMPCAPPMFQVSKDIQTNATDSLLHWICGDKGDKIALFVTENGKECISKSMELIRDCTRDLKSSIVKNLDIKTKCTNYDYLSNCVVSRVAVCDTKVTAVILNSMFEYIRDISPCKDYIKPFGQLKMKQK